MKRTIVAVLCLLSVVCVQAQKNEYYNTKHEVGLSVGYLSNTTIFGFFTDITEILLTATLTTVGTGGTFTGHPSYGDESYIPTISAEYFYHVNPWLGVGGFLAFTGLDRDMYGNWQDNVTGNVEKKLCGKAMRRNFSLIPTAKFDYLRTKYFGMYSKLGVGASMMFESQQEDYEGGTNHENTIILPNFQISLLGMEFGSEQIRGFAELGVGEQGYALAGVKYKF